MKASARPESTLSHSRRLARLGTTLAALASLLLGVSDARAQAFGDPTSTPAVSMASKTLRQNLSRLTGPYAVREVTLALVTPHSEHFVSLTEETLVEKGCLYRTADPSRISVVVQALRNADLKPASKPALRAIERMFTFDLTDGSSIRFSFAETFDSDAALPATSAGELLVARKAFADEMLRWSAQLEQKTNCSYFVDRYR